MSGFKQHNGLMLCFSGTDFINKRFQLSQERNNCTISIYGIIHSSQGICFFFNYCIPFDSEPMYTCRELRGGNEYKAGWLVNKHHGDKVSRSSSSLGTLHHWTLYDKLYQGGHSFHCSDRRTSILSKSDILAEGEVRGDVCQYVTLFWIRQEFPAVIQK